MPAATRPSHRARIIGSVLRSRWPTLVGWLLVIAIATSSLWWFLDRTLAEKRESTQALIAQVAESRTTSYALQLEDLVERMDAVADTIIRRWRQSPAVDLDEPLTGLLSTRHSLFVFILDADGKVVSSSFPVKSTVIPDLSFFRALREGCCEGWQVTPSSFAPVVGLEVVRFSRRLETPDGRFAGALVFAALPNFLATFQDNSVLGPRDFVTVRLLDGPVLTTKMRAGQPKQIFYLQHPQFAGERGVMHEDGSKFKDGFARYVAWQKHSILPLVALSAIAEADAMADFDETAASYRYFAMLATVALLLVGVMVVSATITIGARQAAEDEVRHTYRMATDAANEGFYMLRPVLDASGRLQDLLVEDCNERAATLFGMFREQLLGALASEVLGPDIHARLLETCDRAMRFGSVEDELRVPADSQLRAPWIYRRAVHAGAGIALTLRDISESKAHEEELKRLANQDALTGLPNRHWLTSQLPLAIERAQRSHSHLALLFIDLDNFKVVNDALGHQAGDLLLVEAAARIRSAVRASDHVARLGGDEFTVLLEKVDGRHTVDQIAQKILRAVAAPYPTVGGVAGEVSASIGASLYPDDAVTPEELLRHADTAMYASKFAGKASFRQYGVGEAAPAGSRVADAAETVQPARY